jgi:membrane-bound metal-dependent hydrolase YbcI (DUF457 family)
MDALFHFLFPLMAALAARFHIKHGIGTVLTLAMLAMFLDIDHLFGVTRATFHNVFITLLIPLVIVFIAFKYEKKGNYYKMLSLALLLFLFSHPILDMFTEGGVAWLYPFSDTYYAPTLSITVDISGSAAPLISTASIGLLIYFGILMLVLFLEDLISILKREHSLLRAAEDPIRLEEKRIKKNL